MTVKDQTYKDSIPQNYVDRAGTAVSPYCSPIDTYQLRQRMIGPTFEQVMKELRKYFDGSTPKYHKKIILLVDMDGVMADWYGKLHQELVKVFPGSGIIPSIKELTTYFWEDSFSKEFHPVIEAIVESKGFYRTLVPYPEALDCLKDIQENCLDFIEPFICTKPSAGYENFLCHSEKIQWVGEHLGDFWVKRTILAPDKTIVHGDYLIDDHPNINGVNATPSWKQLMFKQPYNQNSMGQKFSWEDWPELKEQLKIESTT